MLYHGTSAASAERLLEAGWQPRSGSMGSQCGDPRLLYLTDQPMNALWFAEQKQDPVVLEVRMPRGALCLDPEDGVGETVEEEIAISERHGLPTNLATGCALTPDCFRLVEPASPEYDPSP
ncbi:hypothetical protein [Palleronia sp.]|uniref:hypothetical protein n=1 Tax=Palleronia sp. TaxID=1940284 RepID=UPI0035C80C36